MVGYGGKDLQKKGGFKSGMKERVGDEKLIIMSVAIRGINDHIRFYSQMLCTAAIILLLKTCLLIQCSTAEPCKTWLHSLVTTDEQR